MKRDAELYRCVTYAVQLLLGLDHEDVGLCGHVIYGTQELRRHPEPAVRFVPSGLFDEVYATPASLPKLPIAQVEGTPLLYGKPLIERIGRTLVVHADIIASTYFLVTRYEEAVRRDVRDQHGRFPGRESLSYRADFIHRPIVEEYAALLRKWLREVGVDVPEPDRRFRVCLTHDVDLLRRYGALTSVLGATRRNAIRRPKVAMRAWMSYLGLTKDPYDTFDEIIELDGSLRSELAPGCFTSVYFFMAGGTTRHDRQYEIARSNAQRLIRSVRESGAIVGLHSSYEAGMRPELVGGERDALETACGSSVVHNRHHFLALREVQDMWALADAGIKHDYTLGYSEVAGFRLGVCHPISLFDPIKLEPIPLIEHPLIVMDCTLDRREYMGLAEDGAFRYCRQLVDQTRKHKGEFVALWHNTELWPMCGAYHARLYRRLLEYLRPNEADTCTRRS